MLVDTNGFVIKLKEEAMGGSPNYIETNEIEDYIRDIETIWVFQRKKTFFPSWSLLKKFMSMCPCNFWILGIIER